MSPLAPALLGVLVACAPPGTGRDPAPETRCGDHDACPSGWHCLDRTCRPDGYCAQDEDCPPDAYCGPDSVCVSACNPAVCVCAGGRCVEMLNCWTDADCRAGQVCRDQLCADPAGGPPPTQRPDGTGEGTSPAVDER